MPDYVMYMCTWSDRTAATSSAADQAGGAVRFKGDSQDAAVGPKRKDPYHP